MVLLLVPVQLLPFIQFLLKQQHGTLIKTQAAVVQVMRLVHVLLKSLDARELADLLVFCANLASCAHLSFDKLLCLQAIVVNVELGVAHHFVGLLECIVLLLADEHLGHRLVAVGARVIRKLQLLLE